MFFSFSYWFHLWIIVCSGVYCFISSYLCISKSSSCYWFLLSYPCGLWLEYQRRSFMEYSRRLGKLVPHPALTFPARGNFLGNSYSGLDNACLGDWDDASIPWRCSSYPFWVVILQCFVPLCCWNVFSGLQSSTGAAFIHGLLSNYWSLLGPETGVFHFTIFVTSLLFFF